MTDSKGRRFGNVHKLPSGRYRARYWDGRTERMISAPDTFASKALAEGWLRAIKERRDKGKESYSTMTVGELVKAYIATRQNPSPKTLSNYGDWLRLYIAPAFGNTRINELQPAEVRAWHAKTSANTPTAARCAYALLASSYKMAFRDDMLEEATPCRLDTAAMKRHVNAVRKQRKPEFVVPKPEQIARVREEVARRSPHLAVWVDIGAWCALRHAEIRELRRSDFDFEAGTMRVERQAQYIKGQWNVGPCKAESQRTITLPKHVMLSVQAHMSKWTADSPSALLTHSRRKGPGWHAHPVSTGTTFRKAFERAGLPDFVFHELRHTALSMAHRIDGVTPEDAMQFGGHKTMAAHSIYVHMIRDEEDTAQARIAEGMSAMHGGGNVIDLDSRRVS